VMKDGVIQQVDPPRQLYNEPANIFVAGFIGSPQMNMLDGKITYDEGQYYFVSRRMKLPVHEKHYRSFDRSSRTLRNVVMGVRSENIILNDNASVDDESWTKCIVEMSEITGADLYVYVKLGEDTVIVRVDADGSYKKDDTSFIKIDMNKVHFFDKETGVSLAIGGDMV